MHKKFHYRGVSERSIVALEDEFTVLRLYSTYFKSENWGLSGQMKIWRLTFLDSAYSKYESKLELPLLPKNALIFVF